MSLPYTELPDFLEALDQMERPLTVVAHQDDELTFSGVLTRAADRMHIVWVTNGDGLYFIENVSPEAYGKIRMAEALNSATAVGIPGSHTQCLEYSEVDLYQRFMFITENQRAVDWIKPYYQRIIDDLRQYIFEYKPEAVFTCGYQGGNPEHDIIHYFTRLVVDEYERDSGKQVPFIHVPMYEYTVLVALRFNPFYRGLRWRYQLDERERANKRKQLDAYPSQIELFEKFQKVATFAGWLGLFTRGRPYSLEEYLSIEEWGPVPKDWDYLRNPHLLDRANYIGDHFGRVPVSFEKSVKPIIAAFPRL
ncbi:MAG: PIG-L family deacetylase [Candidatus Alcyoniella australis]|nr:PIG-L family deacetylase [Candidatus Alcyoniella australis]